MKFFKNFKTEYLLFAGLLAGAYFTLKGSKDDKENKANSGTDTINNGVNNPTVSNNNPTLGDLVL